MKKALLSLAALSTFGFASVAHAEKVDICVFDLLGKSGESFQMAQEWALAAKGWGADINLIARQDEAVADNDFSVTSSPPVRVNSACRLSPFWTTVDPRKVCPGPCPKIVELSFAKNSTR